MCQQRFRLRPAFFGRHRQLRKAIKRPAAEELDSAVPNDATSPLEAAIGRETLEHYEAALQFLTPDERGAVVMRIELGFSFPEIAAALGKPPPDAARMMVVRAFVKLAREMDVNM